MPSEEMFGPSQSFSQAKRSAAGHLWTHISLHRHAPCYDPDYTRDSLPERVDELDYERKIGNFPGLLHGIPITIKVKTESTTKGLGKRRRIHVIIPSPSLTPSLQNSSTMSTSIDRADRSLSHVESLGGNQLSSARFHGRITFPNAHSRRRQCNPRVSLSSIMVTRDSPRHQAGHDSDASGDVTGLCSTPITSWS